MARLIELSCADVSGALCTDLYLETNCYYMDEKGQFTRHFSF